MIRKIAIKSYESLIVEQESPYPKIDKHYQTVKKFLIEGSHTQMGNPLEFTKRVGTKKYIKIIIFFYWKSGLCSNHSKLFNFHSLITFVKRALNQKWKCVTAKKTSSYLKITTISTNDENLCNLNTNPTKDIKFNINKK